MEYNAIIHEEDGSYWAEVKELPGCFASGDDLNELIDALKEAIAMCKAPDEAPPAAERELLRAVGLTVATGPAVTA